MATEYQSQVGVGQPSAPPSYDSIQPDQPKQLQQQPALGAQLQRPVQQGVPYQQQPVVGAQLQQPAQPGVPYQPWPNQGRVYQPAPVMSQGPVQYIAAPAPAGGPGYQFPNVAVAPPAPYEAPHDFLILAMVTAIICGILNLISLAFGIPAIVLSAMSINSKGNKDYPQAKSYGKYSLLMSVLNIFFTLCLALLITGLVVGCTGRRYYYYYSYGC